MFSQIGEGIVNGRNKLISPLLNNNKSQAEVEAIEEMRAIQHVTISNLQQTNSRRFATISNVIHDDKSQAEAEAYEELQNIQTLSAYPMLIAGDPILVSSSKLTLTSNVMTADVLEGAMQLRR